ncbi:MAG TPA: Nif3-like dinuclear metal center hexameric protein [Actinomycetota bacterium]|nr:Nif3-like dinuclear metal center hexameric protein [Actinomycetota bacterium]
MTEQASQRTTPAPTVGDWVDLVHHRWPAATAEPWDNVGLQVGDPATRATTVLVALDVTAAVLDEAAGLGAGLVVAHHPLVFRPLASVRAGDPVGGLVLRAAVRGTAVLAAHTNFDVAAEGSPSDVVADLLELADRRPLRPAAGEPAADYKYVVFCPTEATMKVLDAAARAGAGIIGNYTRCSFRTPGTGTFQPGEGARPALGEVARLNQVAEERLEVVVPADRLAAVRAAVAAAHPYEEVAADVYPLHAELPGLGRVGSLPLPATLSSLAERLREGLPAPGLRVAGDPDRRVRRVAVLGGSGGDEVAAAVAAGAECYVTGDLKHHQVLAALAAGVACIDATHAATEQAALPGLAERLRADAAAAGWAVDVRLSTVPPHPFSG